MNFIILSRSRTGSNFLVSLLNSHPHIEARGEIVAKKKKRTYSQIIDQALIPDNEHTKAIGFKLFYYHPNDDEGDEVWNKVLSIPDLHVIHLKRANILRTLLSRKLASINKVWKQSEKDSAPVIKTRSTRFAAKELEKGFNHTRQMEAKGEKIFADFPVHEVLYEDLAANTVEAFNGISDFLGLERHEPRSGLVKQNPQPLSEAVENLTELRGKFAGTEWEAFFTDPDSSA